jgi:predicted nucleic acid-binding protein
MNIVIDTAVIIAVVANEPEKEAIIQVTQGADLVAPSSVHWEIGNAFSAMLKRNKVTLAQAQRAIEIYHTIPIRFVEVELDQALAIADQLKIYAYDAYLVRCAIRYKLPLISLDRALLKAAQEMKVDIIEVD